MALTVADLYGPAPHPGGWAVCKKITPDTAWVQAGEALTWAQLGFSRAPDRVTVDPVGGYVFTYDITNQVLLAYWVDTSTDGAPLAAVPDSTNLSSLTVYVEAVGAIL